MPTEVISLLSSDPPSPALPPRHAVPSPEPMKRNGKAPSYPVIDVSSDPIESPPQPNIQSKSSNYCSQAAWDPISSSAHETHEAHHGYSDDSDDLPDLGDIDFSKIRGSKRTSSSRTLAPSSRSKAPASRSKAPVPRPTASTSVAGRIQDRKQKLELQKAEREQKRIEKERVKALAEVNKLRTDRKVATPEMIVDIAASINSVLQLQIEALLQDINVQHNTWNSPVNHVVKWRRKVTSRFNDEMGLWEPIPMRVEDENHTMVIIQASDLVELVFGEKGRDLEAHVLDMTRNFPNSKLIYLIEGLTPWMKKNRNLLNRQYAAVVRGLEADALEPSHRRRNQNQREYIKEEKIEDALLSLQVVHSVLIHHTNASVETAQWVAVFTQHISTIPYRKVRDDADVGFCMESGQVRTSDNAQDTFVLMLQEITRVTPSIAYGISAKYRSVTELIRGFETEGPLALSGCPCVNRDGAPADRAIGQILSKRLYKIFMGQDPGSTDV